MSWVIVEVNDQPLPGKPRIKIFGSFDERWEAEKARRRRHFDNILSSSWTPPSTHVCEIEELPR